MSENELTTTSARVMTRIEQNEYGKIRVELSDQTVSEMITGLIGIAGRLSGDAFQAVSQIYSEAIKAELEIQRADMNLEATILQRFNDQVDNVMQQLDLKDSATVDNFNKAVETLRGNLFAQLSNRKKRSLLDKIFGRR